MHSGVAVVAAMTAKDGGGGVGRGVAGWVAVHEHGERCGCTVQYSTVPGHTHD